MESSTIIHLENLTIRYGSFVAVDGLNLELRRGELFGLLGPNGAGKSSTLRVLIGQRLPSGGRVTIFGRDIVRDWAAIKPLFGDDGPAVSDRADLAVPCLGSVPFDPDLARHCDRGLPLAERPDTPAGHALDQIAERLLAALDKTTEHPR